jgi:ribosomal protein L13E
VGLFGYYTLSPEDSEAALLAVIEKGDTPMIEHLHNTFNHLAHAKLSKMFNLPGKKVKPCSTCSQVKLTDIPKPAPSVSSNITRPGERIDRDTKPLPDLSVEGFSFYEYFIDFFSRFGIVVGLRRQSEANTAFVKLRRIIEAKFGKPVVYLQNDSHPHYVKQAFKAYAEQTGLTLRQSLPREQWQNGFCERHIALVETGAKCLRTHGGAPPEFHYHAVIYANQIQNALTYKSDDRHPIEGAPSEIWHNRKFPDLFKQFMPPSVVRLSRELRMVLGILSQLRKASSLALAELQRAGIY